MVTRLKLHGGGAYFPGPRLVSGHRDLGDLEGLTNEWGAVAVGKDMAHKRLCVNASKVVTRSRRGKDRLGDLKVNERSGSGSLSLLVCMIRA